MEYRNILELGVHALNLDGEWSSIKFQLFRYSSKSYTYSAVVFDIIFSSFLPRFWWNFAQRWVMGPICCHGNNKRVQQGSYGESIVTSSSYGEGVMTWGSYGEGVMASGTCSYGEGDIGNEPDLSQQ